MHGEIMAFDQALHRIDVTTLWEHIYTSMLGGGA